MSHYTNYRNYIKTHNITFMTYLVDIVGMTHEQAKLEVLRVLFN